MRRLIIMLSMCLVMCCVICSCGTVNGYKKKDLVPVNEKPGMSAVQVFVVGNNEGKDITVKIKNLTDDVFWYGEYYSLQIFIEGVWYYIPMTDENVVHDLGHELSPGASDIMTYSLSPYGGKLNPGHYRIGCCGCDIGNKENIYYAEFNVMADGMYQFEIVEPTVA